MLPSLGPPVAFPVLSPLALLDWPSAKVFWAWFQVGLTVLMLWVLLVGVAEWTPTDRWSLAFVTLVMLMWPLHNCISLGQLVVPGLFLIVLGIYFETRHRDGLAGIMFVLATALKPQLGFFFLLFALSRLRWRTWLSAAIVGTILLVVSLGQLYFNHINWISSIQEDYRVAFQPGGVCDPSLANPTNFAMADLRVPLRLLFQNAAIASGLALGLAAVTGCAALWTLGKTRDRRTALLAYSIVAVFSLLAVYHGNSDAASLVLPLLWAFMSLKTSDRPIAILAIVFTVPFYIVSVQAFLNRMAPHSLTQPGHGKSSLCPGIPMHWSCLGLALCCAAGGKADALALWHDRRMRLSGHAKTLRSLGIRPRQIVGPGVKSAVYSIQSRFIRDSRCLIPEHGASMRR